MEEECFECGAPATCWHHVVPQSRGGTKMVPLCGECHAKAHHRNGNMNTREITRTALAAKRARGERVGSVPYGFDLTADGVHLIENAEEQQVIDAAWELRADGLSLRKVAAELARRGMKSRTGRVFGAQQMRRMLKTRPRVAAQVATTKSAKVRNPMVPQLGLFGGYR